MLYPFPGACSSANSSVVILSVFLGLALILLAIGLGQQAFGRRKVEPKTKLLSMQRQAGLVDDQYSKKQLEMRSVKDEPKTVDQI